MKYEILRILIDKYESAGGQVASVFLPDDYVLWEIRDFNDTKLEVLAVSTVKLDGSD